MTTVAVIPARFASTRFPGKPLADKTGKYLIQHVYEQAQSANRVDRVLVATDDERIEKAVKSFGGEARLTRGDHASGTDRVAEVAGAIGLNDDDLVLNIQGDEPEIPPAYIDTLIDHMASGAVDCPIGTLATPFSDDGPSNGPGSPNDPNCVKVVLNARGRALYFSRSLIPYPRDQAGRVDRPSRWLLHLGVYAFRAGTLRVLASDSARASELQRCESLEQLRWMEHGLEITVVRVDHAVVGIDTPEDYDAFVGRWRSSGGSAAAAKPGSPAAAK